MNSDIPNPAQGFSSSKPTVTSSRSDAVLALGKRIVEELGPDQEVDTLARWMAHYIAELIKATEAASGEARAARLAECAAAVLDLWKHRSRLPRDRRPLEDLEPILNALQSLDPGSGRTRYYYQALHESNEGDESPEVRQWLRIAEQLDDSVKILIRYCLARASRSAIDKTKPWVALAEEAGVEEGVEFPVLRFVKSEADLLESLELDNSDRKKIEDRIRRLESFRETSKILLADLRERLDEAGAKREQS